MSEPKDSSLPASINEKRPEGTTTPSSVDIGESDSKRRLLKAIIDKLKSDEVVHIKFIDFPVIGDPRTFLHLDSTDGNTHLILVAEAHPGYPDTRKITLSWWEEATGASGYVRFNDPGYSRTGKTFEGGVYTQPFSSEEMESQKENGHIFILRLTNGSTRPTDDNDLIDLESKVSGSHSNRKLMNTTINYYRERGWIDTISGVAPELSPTKPLAVPGPVRRGLTRLSDKQS